MINQKTSKEEHFWIGVWIGVLIGIVSMFIFFMVKL
jgi:hypothetical protein